jgi:NAD+ kinase
VKFSVVANTRHSGIKKILTKVIGFLDDFELEAETAKLVRLKGIPLDELQGDAIISLGGDGTLLYILSKINKPIFGINSGGVGFLTEMEHTDDIFAAIKNLEKGKFNKQKLQRIDTYINENHVGSALNEVVLHSSRVAKIQGFEISIDGALADSFRGDGLIISTPTGSTSYAMSLGAPILYPTMESHIIVPIAAYRIGARPLVIPSKYNITAKLTGNPEAVMVIDGQEEILITIEDEIKFKKSSKPVELIRFNDNFFERVRTKLRL